MGNEAVVILFGFLLGYEIDNLWSWITYKIPSRVRKGDYAKFIVKEVRIHHNLFGYVSVIAGFFVYPIFLVPVGIGIIVGHRIRDRLFWFVEIIGKDIKEVEKDVKVIGKKIGKGVKKSVRANR